MAYIPEEKRKEIFAADTLYYVKHSGGFNKTTFYGTARKDTETKTRVNGYSGDNLYSFYKSTMADAGGARELLTKEQWIADNLKYHQEKKQALYAAIAKHDEAKQGLLEKVAAITLSEMEIEKYAARS